jgi:protein-disulfide isomerase
MSYEEYPENMLVIKKSLLTTVVVALVFFIVGGLTGYSLGVFAYGRGLSEATARIAEASVGNSPQVAQAPAAQAPSEPAAAEAGPTRLDDVSIDDDPALGPEDAPVIVVEFSDFECPYCSRFRQETMDQMLETFGDDMLLVYRDFPLTQIHPHAQEAAEAAECADDQNGFWDYHDLLFANQAALDTDSLIGYAEDLGLDVGAFTDCLQSGKYTDEVVADLNDGRSYGVSGTPSFFINGVPLVGAQPFVSFEDLINQELGL